MSSVVKSAAKPKRPANPPRVLVVDDEPNLVELVGDVGKDLGCRVISAADVAQAEHVLATQGDRPARSPTLHLPDGDGISLSPRSASATRPPPRS